jgi:hypothetical protein
MQCRSAKTLNTRLLVKPLATFGVPLTVVSSTVRAQRHEPLAMRLTNTSVREVNGFVNRCLHHLAQVMQRECDEEDAEAAPSIECCD